jgi:hypothetical protein
MCDVSIPSLSYTKIGLVCHNLINNFIGELLYNLVDLNLQFRSSTCHWSIGNAEKSGK